MWNHEQRNIYLFLKKCHVDSEMLTWVAMYVIIKKYNFCQFILNPSIWNSWALTKETSLIINMCIESKTNTQESEKESRT